MGLFEKAIATCKAYLKPVKRATRKILKLEQTAEASLSLDGGNNHTNATQKDKSSKLAEGAKVEESEESADEDAGATSTDRLSKLRHKLHWLTQFEKKGCHPGNTHGHPAKQGAPNRPDRPFEQIAKDASEKLYN